MYSLRKIQPGKGLSLTETTAPTAPGPGEVLLRVSSAGRWRRWGRVLKAWPPGNWWPCARRSPVVFVPRVRRVTRTAV